MAHHNNVEKDIDKKAKILDYFFQYPKEFLKTKNVQKALNITQNGYRTMIRNFQFFHYYGVIESENNVLIERGNPFNSQIKEYDNSYCLTRNEKVKFQIPTDTKKRYFYATLVTQLFTDERDDYVGIDDETYILPIVNAQIFKSLTMFSNGVVRDVLLASKIYEYYKCNRGNLLNIVAELSHFEQPIEIKFENGKKIDKGIVESIGIYEDGEIELVINGDTIVLSSIDEIKNIFILSAQYPTSNIPIGRPSDGEQRYYKRPSMNIKTLIDSLKQQKYYKRMVEIYYEYCRDNDVIDDSLEKFLRRLSKPTKDCLTLSERANRRIKVITE